MQDASQLLSRDKVAPTPGHVDLCRKYNHWKSIVSDVTFYYRGFRQKVHFRDTLPQQNRIMLPGTLLYMPSFVTRFARIEKSRQ